MSVHRIRTAAVPGRQQGIVETMGRSVRGLVYVTLLFLRFPVQLVRRLALLPLLAGAIAWGLLAGWGSAPSLWLGGTAVALFVATFLFDTVLLWVAPEDLLFEI